VIAFLEMRTTYGEEKRRMRACAVNDRREKIARWKRKRKVGMEVTWYHIPWCNVPAGYTTTNGVEKYERKQHL